MVLGLRFTNRFTRDLPGDPEPENFRRQVRDACYSRVEPTPTADSTLIAHSPEMAGLLNLAGRVETDEFAQVFTGNLVTNDMDPYAMNYGGHQFGNWAGQLGDGRAIALGEVAGTDGTFRTLQLKGAGPTPYSRMGDGRAVLRSSVREFLCSESMFHLGIPTTRALSLTLTGDQVMRDMFYDGNSKPEPGAVVCRVAPSFLRFGNYQLFAARGEFDTLRTLVDWTIKTHFSHLADPGVETQPNDAIAAWFDEIVRTTADLIVDWMRVGFVHGVMNTDNLSILGLTIDYGPYGWLEGFDPNWTPNTTDSSHRRYRFANQPTIGHWNLVQLANAIAPVMAGDHKLLQESIDEYADRFDRGWHQMTARRLGLAQFEPGTDRDLFGELGRVLQLTETDMVIFHRLLSDVDVSAALNDSVSDHELVKPVSPAWYQDPSTDTVTQTARWLRTWAGRVAEDDADPDTRRAKMARINPKYVLRNWMAQVVIDQAEAGDPSGIVDMADLLRRPYDEQPDHHDEWFARRPEWARERPGCSMLSCSS